MSYVSISRELLNAVGNTIDSMAHAELGPMQHAHQKEAARVLADKQYNDLVYTALLGDLVDLADRLKPHDKAASVIVEVRVRCGQGDDPVSVVDQLNKKMTVPCVTKLSGWGDQCTLKEMPPELSVMFDAYRLLRAEHLEANARWKKVQLDISAFLQKCKSLNEAIKLWPDVVKYIPEEYIKRVNHKPAKTKPEQSEAAKALATMDLDTIKTSTVLARMAGAQV